MCSRKRMVPGSWFPTKQRRYLGRQNSSWRSRAERFLEPDAGLGAFDGAVLLEAGKCPVERLARKPQLTRNVLKRSRQAHGAAGASMEIEVEHDSFFCGANLHQFQALPQLDDLMRHELEKGHRAVRIGAQGTEHRGFGIYAHPRRLRCHGVAMENVGKQRRFDE